MNIDFTKATFKDFENIPGLNAFERATFFCSFLEYMKDNGHMNYRLLGLSGCKPEVNIIEPQSNQPADYVSLVSNDYLGFTQHPKVKRACIESIEKYGTGAGASPLIGGFFEFHKNLETKIASFFKKSSDCSTIFTTGYTANSATLLSLLQKEDIAIVDRAVHTSVFEGLMMTNVRLMAHNEMEHLERILKEVRDKYRTVLVIVDGVYSQDGDISPLHEIEEITHSHGAFLMVDDAHGVGILGETGRGALEKFNLLNKVDILTGTFSKTFANIGGYVISNPEITNFLKFQSRQQIFSATASPASAGIEKAIELIDEEPEWQQKLLENIAYFKNGLVNLGLDVGTTASAIIPVKIGDPHVTGDVGKVLLELGIYTNPILYPAVAKKDARIRMSLMATHKKGQLDRTLEAFEYINKKFKLSELKKRDEKKKGTQRGNL